MLFRKLERYSMLNYNLGILFRYCLFLEGNGQVGRRVF